MFCSYLRQQSTHNGAVLNDVQVDILAAPHNLHTMSEAHSRK